MAFVENLVLFPSSFRHHPMDLNSEGSHCLSKYRIKHNVFYHNFAGNLIYFYWFISVRNATMSCMQVTEDLNSLDLWTAVQQRVQETLLLLVIMVEKCIRDLLEQNVRCSAYAVLICLHVL